MTIALMATSIEDFQVGQILGKGGFACVYRAVNKKEGGREVAIKMIEKRQMREFGMVKKVRDEAKIHYQLQHPNILKLYNCFEDSEYVYLELELCRHGELGKYLRRHGKPPISEPEACSVILQVLNGLLYLHTYGIVHRDITLSNLLLDDKNQIKIADFGLATKLSKPGETHMTMCGTPNYISPEVATKSPHGLPVDVWGVGVLLYTLLFGYPPFETAGVRSTLNRVVKEEVCFPHKISYEAKDLLRRLLEKDQSKRIAARDIILHPFIQNYPERPLQCGTDQDSGVNLTCSLCPCSRIEETSSRCNGMQSIRSQPSIRSNVGSFNSERDSINSFRERASRSRVVDLNNCSGVNKNLSGSRASNFSDAHGSMQRSGTATLTNSGYLNLNGEGLACNSSFGSTSRRPNHSVPLKPKKISTARLQERRLTLGKITYYILRSGNAGMEYTTHGVKFRLQVTKDGNEIIVERINEPIKKKPTLYLYENLPMKLWQKYDKLREFVVMTQSYTRKISMGTKMAACALMESSPDDFTASFFSGFAFKKSGDNVKVTDPLGSSTTYPFDRLLQECKNAPPDHTQHFVECYRRCLELERILEEQNESSPSDLLPTTFGKFISLSKEVQAAETSSGNKAMKRAESTPLKISQDFDGRKSKSMRLLEKTFQDGITLSLNTETEEITVQDADGSVKWFSTSDPIPVQYVDKLRELKGQVQHRSR